MSNGTPSPTKNIPAALANNPFAAGTFADVVAKEAFYRDLEGNSMTTTTTVVERSPPALVGQSHTSEGATKADPPATRDQTENDGWKVVKQRKQAKHQGVADSMHAPFRVYVQASQFNPHAEEPRTNPLPNEGPKSGTSPSRQNSPRGRAGGNEPGGNRTSPSPDFSPTQPSRKLTPLDSDGDSIMGNEEAAHPLPIRLAPDLKGKGMAADFPTIQSTISQPSRASSNPLPRPVSPDSVFAAPISSQSAHGMDPKRVSPRTLAAVTSSQATRRSASPRNQNPPPRADSRAKSKSYDNNDDDEDLYWGAENEVTEEEIHMIDETEARERNRNIREQLRTPTKHKRRVLETIVIDDQGSPTWSRQPSHNENMPPPPIPGPSRLTPFMSRPNTAQQLASDRRAAGHAHTSISNSPLPAPPLPRFTKKAPAATNQPRVGSILHERSASPPEAEPERPAEEEASQKVHIKIERDPSNYIPPTMHVPAEICLAELPFAYPTEGWLEPIGNDPWFFKDNLVVEQVSAWDLIGTEALLIRQAGESYPNDKTEGPRKFAITEILEKTLGPLPDLYLIAPDPENKGDKNFEPPFAYLARGLSPQDRDRILQYRCISSSKGTLFITPNKATIPDYIMSLSGFDITKHNVIIESINKSWDRANLNEEISTFLPTHDELRNAPPEAATQYIRESLRIQVVTAKDKAQIPYHIVHVYLESPTSDPLKWRIFRNFILAISYRDPLISMHIAKYDQWTCKMCHSKIHPTGLCPMLGERGWYIPPDLVRQASQQAAPPVRPTAPSAFSSIQTTNGNKGNKGRKHQNRNNNKNQRGGRNNNN